jgi:hypothetical protein
MTVPEAWLPAVTMERVICHWSAGAYDASWLDRAHYHLIIEGDGNLVRGDRSIADNARPIRGSYAAHTLNCNTGSIGVAMACMAGAVERPFSAGLYPMTTAQWDGLAAVVADLCRAYDIKPTPKTVLSHAEVQDNLGIAQRGKWDFTRAVDDWSAEGARAVGDRLRAAVKARLNGDDVADTAEPDLAEMEMRGVVTASTLNFRSAPSGPLTGSLPRGTVVAVLEVEHDWYRVRTPAGYVGWVYGRYVAIGAS